MLNREVLIRVYDERKCFCGRLFYVPKEGARVRSRPSYVRKRNAFTCSPKCTIENRQTQAKKYKVNRQEKIKLKTGEKDVDSK